MESKEELLLLQLLQSQHWEKLQNVRAADAESPDHGIIVLGTIPDQWELTRGLELHSWQNACVDAWFSAGLRGVVKVVTGAGKTLLALAIMERLQRAVAANLAVAIVVPTVVLLEQWQTELTSRSNLPETAIGLMGGGYNDTFDVKTRVLICVLNSAAKKLPIVVAQAGVAGELLLVVDECHRAGATEMRKVFETARKWSLGLSATPERENDTSLDDEFDVFPLETSPAQIEFEDTVLGQELGPVIFELNYAEAIRLGVLPPFEIQHYGLSLKAHERVQYERLSREIKNLREELERPGRKGLALIRWCRSRAAASSPAAARLIALTTERKRMLYRMEDRGNAVLRLLQLAVQENPNVRAILFHESIAEVMRLFSLLRAEGFAVVAEHSEFPDHVRSAAIRLFREGTAQVMISARSLIEGFNVPAADLGIVIAASSSVRQRIQTLGRLLRKSQANGIEKAPMLCVLYANDTVDEAIYEKTDWEQFTGAERNQYFLWPDVKNATPRRVEKAPRAPPRNELTLDQGELKPSETYPGDIDEGFAYTRDTQGTIRTEGGDFIESHAELVEVLKQSRRPAGRFRITPQRRYVIELDKTVDGWRGVYLGRLNNPIVVVANPIQSQERDWRPGDHYPLSQVKGRTFSVLQRDPRLIALKDRGRTRFVQPAEDIQDDSKRETVVAIQSFLKTAYSRGHRVSKITVTPRGHVVYVFNNEAVFVGNAPEGAEGFMIES